MRELHFPTKARLTSDLVPDIQIGHGDAVRILAAMGFSAGVSPDTFNHYIKSLRKIGIPFAYREHGVGSERRARYSYNHLMELCLVLSLREYGALPARVVAGIIEHRQELNELYRRAYIEYASGLGAPVQVTAKSRAGFELRGVFLDLRMRRAGGRVIAFGPPRVISPFEALRIYSKLEIPDQRDGLRYASDTADAEWALIEPHLPAPADCGRPRGTNMRDVVNAIFYIAQSGCQWRLLPKDFPPYSTVQRYFYAWRDSGVWQTINHILLLDVREAEGRNASPSAGVIDSQSVKTTESGGPRGYDAGKKIKGRKRHLLTDTIGLPVAMIVHPAGVQDRDGAPALLASMQDAFPWLRHVFADGGYAGDKLKDALAGLGDWTIEIVKRSDCAKGFVLLPRRWVVERTIAWLNRNRRLAKNVEATIESAETWLYIASVKLMSRRLAVA